MASAFINVRTDSEVKAAADKIFNDLGMNMSTAINIFLRQTIRENGLPFSLTLNDSEENKGTE